MELTHCQPTAQDFAAFYATCFPNDGANLTLRAVLQHEWEVLLHNPTTLSVIVEDKDQPLGQRIVGCGQAVFVTEEFAQMMRCGLPPWVNAHVIYARPDGTHPYFLDLKGIRAANSGAGLSSLGTRWTITGDRFNKADGNYVRRYLYNAFSLLTQGYNHKETFLEAAGREPMEEGLRAGYRLLNDYQSYYREQGIEPPLHPRPYLLHLTREEALMGEGSTISYIFAYTPPRIFFTPREQELLCLALARADDATCAARLHLTKWSIQQRWRAIHQRTQDRLPDLLPEANEDDSATRAKGRTGAEKTKRGTEKKRVLLHYLQSHLEELRPVNPPGRAVG